MNYSEIFSFQSRCGEFVADNVGENVTQIVCRLSDESEGQALEETVFYYPIDAEAVIADFLAVYDQDDAVNALGFADVYLMDDEDEAEARKAIAELDAEDRLNFVHGLDTIDATDYVLEIYEFWTVSDYLAGKLIEAGHPVERDFYGLTVWGRCTTGQAIKLDGVIEQIVRGTA